MHYTLQSFRLTALTLLSVLSVCLMFSCTIRDAHAQSYSFAEEDSLKSTPSFPAPHTPVIVELNEHSTDALGSSIRWFVDGVEQTKERNMHSLSVTTGDVGKTTTVRAVSTRPNGFERVYTKTVTPSVVDVIIESDTYVPSFYLGRSLPNSGAHIRAIAVVHDGKNTDKSTYTYEWGGGPGASFNWPMKGAQTIEYTLPLFDGNSLSVTVHDATGAPVGKGSALITYAQPELHFYQSSALSGYASRALTDTTQLIGDETVVVAEPYNTVTRPQEVRFKWQINGADTPDTLNTITVARPDSSGSSVLSATMSNVQRPLEYLMKSLKLTF